MAGARPLQRILHITAGDSAGELLERSGIDGEILAWRDLLYDGPRNPGWPNPNRLPFAPNFCLTAPGGAMSPLQTEDGMRGPFRFVSATNRDLFPRTVVAC